jgi:hypothetical protein
MEIPTEAARLSSGTPGRSHRPACCPVGKFPFLIIPWIVSICLFVLWTSLPVSRLAELPKLRHTSTSSNAATSTSMPTAKTNTPKFDALNVLASLKGPPTTSLHGQYYHDTATNGSNHSIRVQTISETTPSTSPPGYHLVGVSYFCNLGC